MIDTTQQFVTGSQTMDGNYTTSAASMSIKVDVAYVTYYNGLMAAMALVSLVLNSLVIAAAVMTPSLRTISNYYIIALAIINVFQGLFYSLYSLGSIQPPLKAYISKYI